MDLVCLEDIDEFASETEDEDVQLEQDLRHRLEEDYGSNPDDDDRGVGILNRISSSDDATKIGRLIEADFVKDERVITCSASVTINPSGNTGALASIAITVTTTDDSLKLGYSVSSDGPLSGGIVS